MSALRTSAILLVLVTAACTSQRDGLITQDRAIRAELSALPLPTVTHAPLKPLPPALRVRVHDGVVDVDDLGLWLSRPGRKPDDPPPKTADGEPAWTRAQGIPTTLSDDNDYLLPALFDVLKQARETAQDHAERRGEDYSGHYNLYVAQDTPYEIVVRVLYTLGQAEYGDFLIAARRGDDIGGLSVQLPKFCAASGRTRDDTPMCMSTNAYASAAGLQLNTRSVYSHRGCTVLATAKDVIPDLQPSTPNTASLEERLGTAESVGLEEAFGPSGPDDASLPRSSPNTTRPPRPASSDCVFLPRVGGALAVDDLGARLSTLRGERALCHSAQLGAANSIPWSDVIAAFDGLIHGGYEWMVLMAGDPPASCE